MYDDLETLMDAAERLRLDGFDHEFQFTDDNCLTDTGTDAIYEPEVVEVVATHRNEGLTDPGDESLLMALRTPDGVRGLLVTRYGHDVPHAEALRRLGTDV